MGSNDDTRSDEEEVLEPILWSTFCSTCQEIFTGDIGRFECSEFFPHHRDLDAINRAVNEKCYICSRSWTNTTLEDGDFFHTSALEASAVGFSMGYQVTTERDANGGYWDRPWNTIRIILECKRQQDGRNLKRHVDNFFAFSSRGRY